MRRPAPCRARCRRAAGRGTDARSGAARCGLLGPGRRRPGPAGREGPGRWRGGAGQGDEDARRAPGSPRNSQRRTGRVDLRPGAGHRLVVEAGAAGAAGSARSRVDGDARCGRPGRSARLRPCSRQAVAWSRVPSSYGPPIRPAAACRPAGQAGLRRRPPSVTPEIDHRAGGDRPAPPRSWVASGCRSSARLAGSIEIVLFW